MPAVLTGKEHNLTHETGHAELVVNGMKKLQDL
jgi:hypothetical protein